jgi:hypothetical protein
MNYKITCHLMPWELDYALLSFTQLQKAKHYISNEDNIYIDVTLNLSDYIINWSQSKISKQFFIDKFNHLKHLLNKYICSFEIYDGNNLYGGLNSIIESTDASMDYYIILNPDMYFSEKSLYYLIESSKLITNKYFVINQQIPKLWDDSWNEISNSNYQHVDYEKWHEIGFSEIQRSNDMQTLAPELVQVKYPKWAGWFDLYNKNMWNDFWVYHKDWSGYGACDYYTMLLAQHGLNYNIDFQQYMITNQMVYPYWANKDLIDFSSYYKNQLKLNEIPNQRDAFNQNMSRYLELGLKNLINNNQ